MAQEFALAAPRTEEMMKTATGLAGAVVAGVVEGVVVRLAPRLGALGTPLTWATVLAVPAIGIAGALFTRGMIADLFQGMAAGGTAIVGYVVPGLVLPETVGKKGSGDGDVKLLNRGRGGVALDAQNAAVRSVVEF